MSSRRPITNRQRRARIAQRHAITPWTRVGSLREAAEAMGALHGTDVVGGYLQAWARVRESTLDGLVDQLYGPRTEVLKLMGMRRTLFISPLDGVATIHHAAALDVARNERRRTLALFGGEDGLGVEAATRLAELEALGLEAVRGMGEATTTQLTRIDPRLGQRIEVNRDKAYAGSISIAQRVFLQLALDGHIARGRPQGTWKGSQVRWSPIERWLPDGIPSMTVEEARTRLVRRWLRVFGPGTREDLRWWTGWTVAALMPALAGARAVEVTLDDGRIGWVLPDDLEPDPDPPPWVALLPALDATSMGWIERDWYLGPHKPRIFDSVGNAGPTVWVDGRIVGGWAQRPSGEIATWALEDIGSEATTGVGEEAARLEAWLGAERFRTSFPTPLEVELRDR